jgi:hypothetical protein
MHDRQSFFEVRPAACEAVVRRLPNRCHFVEEARYPTHEAAWRQHCEAYAGMNIAVDAVREVIVRRVPHDLPDDRGRPTWVIDWSHPVTYPADLKL